MSGPRHLYLVDGSGYIFRAFYALPPLTRADGTPTGAVYGFTQMVMKLVEDTDADAIAVIFDAARETFRNKIYPAYKANRAEPPEELIPQFALIREATRALNLPAVEMRGYEADDLIATYARLAREQGAEVTIVSADKDLMQLVRPGVVMFDPIKSRKIGPEEVKERFGVPPEKVVDVQSLAGDFDRQRSRHSRHRRQDRGRADQCLWRSRYAAEARQRDQATEAPRAFDRARRQGAALPRAGEAQGRCAG